MSNNPGIQSQKSGRFHWPKPGIAVQIHLFIIVLALSLVVVTALSWIDAGQQAVLRSQSDINDGLQVFESDFNRAMRDQTALGNWLVSQKTLTDLVQSRDTDTLARYLEPWTEVNIADSILVSNKQGDLLAQVGVGDTMPLGASVKSLPGFSDTLSGRKSSGLAPDASGRLLGRIILPLYSPENQSVVGGILLGFYVDGSFLKYQSRRSDQEIALIYQGKMSILTLTDQQGKPWMQTGLSSDLQKAQTEGHSSDFLTVDTQVGSFMFRFQPLDPAASPTEGVYGVGVSLGSIDLERFNLFRTFGWGIIAVALGGSFIGFLLARTLITPIQTLGKAAQAMASGDLSSKIELRRDDEFGVLAQQMESMRKQLRQALDSANLEKSRYAAVIRDMGAAAVITDENLDVVSANLVAQALLGQSESELRGRSWRGLFVNGASASSPPPIWVLGATEGKNEASSTARARLSLRDRPQVTFEVISTVVEQEGKPAGYVHILRDTTSEAQLVRSQDEFIMNAAHELRGPLASLRASIELLVEDYAVMPKQEMAVMLKTLQRAVVKFQGLAENLIDIGNIQAGRFRVRPTPTRLDSMVADALAQIGPLLAGRAQRVEERIDDPQPCTVLADRTRIVQVLINLISNASKYGPEGERIDLHAFKKNGFMVVEVTDRGPGIALEEQTHIFQRFYRGRRAEEEGIGIGLGLALAREIVTAHGGQMDVRSALGEGTTFWFTLPMVKPTS